MSVIAVTSSSLMQRTRDFVRRLNLLRFIVDVKTELVGKRTLVNLGGQAGKQIGDLRNTFIDLRKAFLDQAAITAEITAYQILDDVGMVSANVGKISSQLKWVSNQVLDAGT